MVCYGISGVVNREFLQRRREQQTSNTGLDWQKNNLACALLFFVHFLAIVARLHETS